MSDMYNSPKVRVRYTHRRYNCTGEPDGFDAEFVIGWSHRDGHEKFERELISLIDGLHGTCAKWNDRERAES